MERSYERIVEKDLARLLYLAESDIASFFARNPKYIGQYQIKQSLVVLAQGAALHYLDHRNGVKDFDVWFFFPKFGLTLPYRRRGVVDFGESKFGVHPDDVGYKGRRVDVLMRSDKVFGERDPEASIQTYLSNGHTKSARCLAQKAVVGLWPKRLMGGVLWPSNQPMQSDQPSAGR